jgi:valyl-tRNA synthetase
MKTPVARAVVTGPADTLDRLRPAAGDLRAVGSIAALEFAEADGPVSIEVTLSANSD